MGEYIPNSSAEYAAELRRKRLEPQPCEIKAIEWHSEKNLMVLFIWNGKIRQVNVSHFFRKGLGKLTKDVRDSIIEKAPERITISTRSVGYGKHKKRYLHEAAQSELAEWLARIQT